MFILIILLNDNANIKLLFLTNKHFIKNHIIYTLYPLTPHYKQHIYATRQAMTRTFPIGLLHALFPSFFSSYRIFITNLYLQQEQYSCHRCYFHPPKTLFIPYFYSKNLRSECKRCSFSILNCRYALHSYC